MSASRGPDTVGVGRDSNGKETASCSACLVDRVGILLFPRIVFRRFKARMPPTEPPKDIGFTLTRMALVHWHVSQQLCSHVRAMASRLCRHSRDL